MPTTEVTPSPVETGVCPLCGAALDPENPTECPKCDWVLGYRRHKRTAEHPSGGRDVAALVMSVVPGAGHLYKGHTVLGVVLMACTILVAGFVVATVSATVGVALLLIPIYWSAVMLHAYWVEDLALHQLAPRLFPH